jgi:iron complex transport system permease protein
VTNNPREGLRIGPFGVPWRPRALAAALAALALLLVLIVAGVAQGSTTLAPGDVIRTLLDGGTYPQHLIGFDLRLPRVLTGVLVGICLGVAGALTQTFTNNPLATPDVIGVTAGASTGAVAAILIGGGSFTVTNTLLGSGIPVAATIGALLASALVYGLGWRDGVDSYRLILVGIGVQSVLVALTSYLLVRAQINDATRAAAWLVGSLTGASWTSFWPLLASQSTVEEAKTTYDAAATQLKAAAAASKVTVTVMYGDADGAYVVKPGTSRSPSSTRNSA